MKKKTLFTILLLLVLVLQVVMQVYLTAAVIRMNVLPDLYVLLVALGMLLVIGIVALLLFLPAKKPASTVLRIVACVISVAVTGACLAMSIVVTDAYNTVHTITNQETTGTRNMYVFVRFDDPAVELDDAGDYTFAKIENYDVKHAEGAIAYIEETLGKTISVTDCANAKEMAEKLLGEEVGALIMNGASVAILQENEEYADFSEKIRILETMPFSRLEEEDGEAEPPVTEPKLPKDVTNAPFVLYISGSDTRSSKLTVSRSDVNILAVVNPVTKQVLLINTPRDYYVPNPAGDGAMDKLTHCGLYGAECSMEALGELYDLEVDFYGQLNFKGFETFIDAIGGVDVYLDQPFRVGALYIPVGENHFNGSRALLFARARKTVPGGDNGRGKNQMRVIKAVVEKLTSGTTIISNYSSILESLSGMFSTSMSMDDISMLVKMQLTDMAKWNVQSFAVTGVDGREKTYSVGGYAYVMHEDERSTAYAAELAQRVIDGEILTEEDMKLPK